MKVKNFWVAVMVIFSVLVFSSVQAEMKAPTVYGALNAAAIDEDAGDDWHFKAVEALVGVRGMYAPEQTDFFKVAYNIELDITGAINESDATDEFTIENALLAFLTPYGTFIACPTGESGHQLALYAAVDQFEIFEADRNGGLYDQPDDGGSVLAYISPKFAGFEFGFANLNLGDDFDDNDDESEAWAVKLMYDKKDVGPGTVRAGIGYVDISETVVGGVEGYDRVAVTGQYLFNAGHNIGFAYEMIENHPAFGDYNTLGIAGKIQLPQNFSIKAAYLTQDDDLDGEAIIANLTYQPGKMLYFYIEYAGYDDVTPDPSYLAIGTKLTF